MILFRKLILPLLLLCTIQCIAFDDLAKANSLMSTRSLSFTENKGQVIDQYGAEVKEVLFKASQPGLDVYITTKGLTFIFLRGEKEKGGNETEEDIQIKWSRTDLLLKNASIKKENIISSDPAKDYFNYYTPLYPKGILNVQTFKKIRINEIYPGIDWIIYISPEGLKYDLEVHPGADPNLIRMVYEGAGQPHLDTPQRISIKSRLGKLSEGELKCYEKESGKTVASSYLLKKNEVSVKLDAYDNSKTLLIDPPLVWSTFYGGTMLDGPRGVDVDNAGNFIVAGYTASPAFFTVNPGGGAYFQGVNGGNTDVAIMKFDNAGVLLWATYYGGSSSEWAWDVDADNSGNILVTGRSHSPNFPTTNPGGGAFFQGTCAAGQDAFIIKFNNAGVCFWSTYYGGNSVDEAFGIAADANGNFALVGCTQSTDYLSANLLLNPGGGAYYQPVKDAIYDLFLIKFDPNGVMLWGTYFGGNSQDFFPVSGGGTSQDLAFDASGDLFVTGQTLSTNFPTLNPGGGAYFQGTLAGNFDAFILKFDPSSVLTWSTYYGGASGDDVGFDTKVNTAGDLYVTGYTASTNFPTLNPGGGAYFQGAFAGGFYDAFILRFDNLGVCKWATYYGGNGRDIGFGSRVDLCDNYYVTGGSTSSNLFTFNPGNGSFFDGSFNGAGGYSIGDMFILKFDVNDVCSWATYLGGNNDEWGEDIAVDGQANVFVGGEFVTGSTAPVQNPGGGAYFQASGSGNDDGAYLKFSAPTILTASTTQTNVLCNGDSSGTATANPSGGTAPYTYTWAPGGQTTQTATGLSAGTYTLTVSDANCNQLTSQVIVTITEPPPIIIAMSSTQPGCTSSTGTATASPTGGVSPYTYSWSNSQTTSTATGLPTGTYTVYVTDANGCTEIQTILINAAGAPAVTLSQVDNPCNGSCIGTSSSTVTGGTSPYTYSWSNNQTIANASGLCAGTYTLTVTDVNGCTTTQTVTITEPPALVINTTQINICCFGSCNGSATANPSGGTPGYTFSWSPGGQITQNVSNLCAGNYNCFITDANGCTQSTVITITQPQPFVAAANASIPSFCPGGCTDLNGSATGGTAPYYYSWVPGNMTSDTVNVCPTATTTYTLFMTDSLGCCISNAPVTVNVSNISIAMASVPAACTSSTGTATATPSNGTAPYTYSWNNSQTTQTATGLSAGTYTVTVTDANGCTQTQTVTVTSTNALTLVMTSLPSGCALSNGTATATPANGTAPYTYNWNMGQTTQTATGLAAGNYTVGVTDANGCSQTQTVTVTQSGGPTAIASASSTNISPGGNSQLTAGGGVSYSWSPASGLNCTTCQNPIATPAQTTTYCVRVTDAGGCTDSACVTIVVEVPCDLELLKTLLPNAFSPDGNGVNDQWCVPANTCIKSFTLKVFDRWGEKVFETDNLLNCWDGSYKDHALNTSVFVYYFEATLTNGDSFKQKGNISLVR